MRNTRRLSTTLTGIAIWGGANAPAANAMMPDPGVGGFVQPQPSAAGTPVWRVAVALAITALLVVAVVALIISLRHLRASSWASITSRARSSIARGLPALHHRGRPGSVSAGATRIAGPALHK